MNRMNTDLMSIRPRAEIRKLEDVHHGAPNYTELETLGFTPDQVIDFSTNCNPFGPAPAVMESVKDVPADRYPDRECLALRRALAEHHEISIENIQATNGTAELIWLIALAYLSPGDPVLILGPTFGEYANAAAIMGAQVDEIRANAEDDFVWDQQAITQQLEKEEYRLVFICNPNNPTGQIITQETISCWVRNHANTLFVIDEAYAAFSQNFQSAIKKLKSNILVMRSMTKDYALAGLRLGYAVALPQVIQALQKIQPPWSVNALAQAAGLAALREQAYLQECLDQLQREKENLVTELNQIGYRPIPSQTHYFLLKVENGSRFRSALFGHGIQVRDCASFGLPEYVRISTRQPHENQKLLSEVQQIEPPRRKGR